MKQANLILASKEALGALRRAAAARIKADGADCSHLMHEIGATDEDNYDEQLKKAMSIVDVIPTPSDIQTPNFKERRYYQHSITTPKRPPNLVSRQ